LHKADCSSSVRHSTDGSQGHSVTTGQFLAWALANGAKQYKGDQTVTNAL